MQKTFLRLILSLSIVFPIFVYGATESYIGTSLGLDFYSVIDDGSYTITEQLVGRALAKVQTLGNL